MVTMRQFYLAMIVMRITVFTNAYIAKDNVLIRRINSHVAAPITSR